VVEAIVESARLTLPNYANQRPLSFQPRTPVRAAAMRPGLVPAGWIDAVGIHLTLGRLGQLLKAWLTADPGDSAGVCGGPGPKEPHCRS